MNTQDINNSRPDPTNTSYQNLIDNKQTFLSPQEEHIINKIDELTQQFNKIPRLDRDKQISKIRHNLTELQECVYLIALKRLKIK